MNFEPLTDKQEAAMVLKPLLRPQTLRSVDGRGQNRCWHVPTMVSRMQCTVTTTLEARIVWSLSGMVKGGVFLRGHPRGLRSVIALSSYYLGLKEAHCLLHLLELSLKLLLHLG